MSKYFSFGDFLVKKRVEKNISARQLASYLFLSAVYICDIEKGRRPAPGADILIKISGLLSLNKKETELMYDLAARSKNSVSADLPDYIMDNNVVREALRTAKEYNIDDREWKAFISRITGANINKTTA